MGCSYTGSAGGPMCTATPTLTCAGDTAGNASIKTANMNRPIRWIFRICHTPRFNTLSIEPLHSEEVALRLIRHCPSGQVPHRASASLWPKPASCLGVPCGDYADLIDPEAASQVTALWRK